METLNIKKKSYRIPHYTVRLVKEGVLPSESKTVDGPAVVVGVARPFIGNTAKEHFVCLLLNSRNHLIGLNLVSVGTLSASLVHPREVFQPAILASAAAIIVVHNHPSGDTTPSPEDKSATKRLKESGELLGIPVLDHVVLSTDGFFSFRENGLLP